jgi:phosphatidylserine/phosphatidylglycerophosphate/cardiolipin synthase-like enzyme
MLANRPGRHRHEIFPDAVWASRRLLCLLRAWLLVAAAVLCAAPADAAAPSATIDTCFAPESDCAALAVRVIDRAEHEILVGAYGLTTGAGIVEALLRAHRRGVEVKLIADKTTPVAATMGSILWRAPACPSGSTTARGSRTLKRWSSTAP